MKVIKDFLFSQKLEKVRPTEKAYLKTKTNVIQSLTLLTDAQHYDEGQMVDAIAAFTTMGLDCNGFLINASSAVSADERIELITSKDCTWYDVPKQNVLVKWLQHKTNLLIVINTGAHPTIRYLKITSNSLLKSAVVFSDRVDEEVNFCVQMSKSDLSLHKVCMSLYQELMRVNGV